METHLSHPDFDDLKKRVEALEKKRSCTPHNLMEKIDIEKLGVTIFEYKDGTPYSSTTSPILASRQLAEKANEIIEYISSLDNPLTDK